MKIRNVPFIPTIQIAQHIEELLKSSEGQRKSFERRWYNNNFFDDGYHYRFVSKTTGKVVDLSTSNDSFIPYRAIPKASRQIRGVGNLLVGNNYVPVIRPEKVLRTSFQDDAMYQEAMKRSKDIAHKVGYWVEDEWKSQHLDMLLMHMVILAAKHGVSFMEVWPDAVEEKICTGVFDAFEIYVPGSLYNLSDCPYLIKSIPQPIAQIKANEEFDVQQLRKISPDNKYASSEIKEAYMLSRYGTQRTNEHTQTLIVKEAFIKEYITEENMEKVAKDLGEDFKDKEKGDPIIRQIFEAGSIWLRDKYINLSEYPFVDFRFEPGPIYQVPLIERFIPANKTLDNVMSRVERHIGTMAVGVWLKRRGENFKVNNIAGGQEVEYESVPPQQMQTTQLGSYVFNFIDQLNSIIEEQGASTSSLGQLPPGVKSGVAIESMKATEYANLKIATDMLKDTVKRIGEMMIDIAATHFIEPQTVYHTEDGNPAYFDIIGEKGIDAYKKINKKNMGEVPDAVPIKKDYKVDVEVESGLGYTTEGKRNTMMQIIEYMRGLAQEGYLTKDAVTIVIKKFLEVFQFGNTQEFMEAMEGGTPPITDGQIEEMKIAFLSVIKDLQNSGKQQPPEQSVGVEKPIESGVDEDILRAKTGMMEAILDAKNANLQGSAT